MDRRSAFARVVNYRQRVQALGQGHRESHRWGRLATGHPLGAQPALIMTAGRQLKDTSRLAL
jgi:hypothetical protein